MLFESAGSKDAPAKVFGCSLSLRIQKKYTRAVSDVTTLLMGLKQCTHESVLLLFGSAGSKKYTRDISEVTTLLMGLKQCIHEDVWLLFGSTGSKKCTRTISEVTTVLMGSKKCTRAGVGCSLSVRVQKNIPAL